MTGSDHRTGGRGGRRPETESSASDQPRSGTPLDEPAVSRATLARRLRAVERALGETEGIEFEPESERVDPDDLDAVAERLDALCRAVRAVGECLEARERVRRADDGIETVRRAIEALPDAGDEADDGPDRPDANDGTRAVAAFEGGFGSRDGEAGVDRGGAPDESATEWLDRVAAGGVAPPPVE